MITCHKVFTTGHQFQRSNAVYLNGSNVLFLFFNHLKAHCFWEQPLLHPISNRASSLVVLHTYKVRISVKAAEKRPRTVDGNIPSFAEGCR